MDYHLPERDGLHICRTLKQRGRSPGVLLYSAFAGPRLAIPAALAGADGLLHKSAPAPELFRAIRAVARGERVMPPIPRELWLSPAPASPTRICLCSQWRPKAPMWHA